LKIPKKAIPYISTSIKGLKSLKNLSLSFGKNQLPLPFTENQMHQLGQALKNLTCLESISLSFIV